MTEIPPFPPRVPSVEPELLLSAIFLFGEYLARLEAETPGADEDEEENEDKAAAGVDTREVLELFTAELGTSVTVTLTLYMRITALYRLLDAIPALARLAMDQPEFGGALTEDAVLAASRLDLYVTRQDGEGAADFDPREFRDALGAL
jgi:hypothetical protein